MGRNFDTKLINPNRFFIDLGINLGSSMDGLMFSWKTCCMKNIEEQFKRRGMKKDYYYWCLTKDSCALAMESYQGTNINNAGHLFTQFYPLSKNQFFAKGIYPFQRENGPIEGLAMRTVSHEIMQACEHRERFDPVDCILSFKLSGNRVALELEGNDDRTYGVRQEHRISLALFGAMVSIFQIREWPAIGFPRDYRPYIVHPTSLLNKFTQHVFFTWSRFFQEILGSAPPG